MKMQYVIQEKTLPIINKVKRPGIFEDQKLRHLRNVTDHSKFYYGFASLEQLRDWFHDEEEIRLMKKDGFIIGIYRCKHYIIGDKQSIFIPENYTRTKTMNL